MGDAIRVLVADDHAVVRQGLRLLLDLQPDIELVGEAADGREAVDRADELVPDVIVMDVVMPGVDGVAATRTLRRRQPHVRVLALSSFSDEDRVLPALSAGAVGFLTKEAKPEELVEAIRRVHRGEPVLCADATRRVLRRVGGDVRPEGTVTVVFTDIEGSTQVLERLGDEGARQAFREHDRLVRETLERSGGVEVEREGDAFMLAFSGARRAALWAVDLQRALTTSELPFRVRAGLNTGEVIAEDHGYFGRAVFVASRVARAAAGGEILVSELTRTLVGDEGVAFRDRGARKLKGLRGTHRLFEVVWSESAS